MLRNSYGTLRGGSRSKTSRAIASQRSRDPPAVARSLPQPSIVTPKWLHLAAQSTLKGSLAAPPNGAIQPVVPQPRAHGHEVGPAVVGDGLAVPVGRDRGADLAAALADDRDRAASVAGCSTLADPAVEVADDAPRGRARSRMYGSIAPVAVELAHPVELGRMPRPANVSMKRLPTKWRA